MSDSSQHDPGIPANEAVQALSTAAVAVPSIVVAVGVLLAVGKLAGRLAGSATSSSRLSATCDAASTLLLCAAAGWASRAVLRAVAARLVLLSTHVQAAKGIERGLGLVLERLAGAPVLRPASAVGVTAPANALDEIRQALRDERWDEARTLFEDYARKHPDEAAASGIAGALDQARAAAVESLRARIDSARAVNDPDRVLELYQTLAPLLEGEPRRELDRELARWSMNVIHKRLRVGLMRPDVAVLAGRVAECFDHTAEGASLRAALPTLRRSAGLCARCAQPYAGIADACPQCLAAGPSSANPAVSPTEDQAPDADLEGEPPTDSLYLPEATAGSAGASPSRRDEADDDERFDGLLEA